MIAESPAIAVQEDQHTVTDGATPMSLNRVVASLQVMLAARRYSRTEEYVHWYNIARGM